MASTHRQQIKILKQQEQILKAINGLEQRMAELSETLQSPATLAIPVEPVPQPEPESKAQYDPETHTADGKIKPKGKAKAEVVKVEKAMPASAPSTNLPTK